MHKLLVIKMPFGKRVERTLIAAGLVGLLGGAYVMNENITALKRYQIPENYKRIV